MDPAFANVLRCIPSNGSVYTRSPLRQTILGRSARGGSVGRRSRGGVPFKEARPPSIVDAPEVLATELGDMDSSPLKSGVRSPLLNEEEILEEDSDDGEYIRVKKVEKVLFFLSLGTAYPLWSLEVLDAGRRLPSQTSPMVAVVLGIRQSPGVSWPKGMMNMMKTWTKERQRKRAAETEDDYHDARQSIGPSEDFHSVRTMMDNRLFGFGG
jgi:hypothetical protein